MTYRNRRLLDLAHESPCFADFPHACMGSAGCDPAHSDSQVWGRGMSHKSHDFAIASMCNPAHKQLDTMDREEKQASWLRAHVKTMAHFWQQGWLRVAA